MPGFDTVYPADSVEFCPHPDFRDLFVCGTYKLEQSVPVDLPPSEDDGSNSPPPSPSYKQQRKGECLLFHVNSSDKLHYSLLQRTALPAILDMKWCHALPSADPTLAIANSEGGITLHTLQKDEEVALSQIASIPCASKDTLCLSIDWSNRRRPTSTLGSLIASLSDGYVSLLCPDESSGLIVTDSWHAHDHEPWIAAWNYWDSNIVYSGGDDLKMKGWDIRQSFDRPIFVNRRFDAGVTTIQSHPCIEHLIAVGSYDDTVRLFDTRKPLTPLTQVDVGGGAWRVKWHPSPSRQTDLLVACMHDGCKVVRFNFNEPGCAQFAPLTDGQSQQWEVTTRFDVHESMAYGVDWSFAEGKDGAGTLVASCSFNDHVLHMWNA